MRKLLLFILVFLVWLMPMAEAGGNSAEAVKDLFNITTAVDDIKFSKFSQFVNEKKIGKDPVQNQLKDAFGDELQKELNVEDFRVNQTQSSVNKKATGLNRPDIQFTYKGRRYYIEIDTQSSNRGPEHKRRIIANDPSAASNELPAELKNISVTVEGKIYKLTGGVTLITAPL